MWRCYNDRGVDYTTPLAASNGCNNLTYVSFGAYNSSARLPIVDMVDGVENTFGPDPKSPSKGGGGYPSTNHLDVRYVVMVFGSQNGGGRAVLSNMPRKGYGTTTDAGLFNVWRSTRIDGVAKNPTVTGLSGSWQVLSFETGGSAVAGLGVDGWGSNYGGQNYAEVLLFTNQPTQVEIQSAEQYLAKKWAVASYATSGVEARAYGVGAMTASGPVRLGGKFAGTLTIPADSSVEFVDTRLAPTNPAAVPMGTQDALWFDTNRKDLTTTYHDEKSLCDRLGTLKNIVKSNYYPLCGGGRGPGFVETARGWGPELRWYDYRRSLTGGDGNMSRFVDNYSGSGNTFDTKTVFMVLDTSNGTGTPFLDTSVYAASTVYLQARWANAPIYNPKEGGEFITNSPSFLNGEAVKSGEDGFNVRAEVLSSVFSQSIPIKVLTTYTHSDSYELRHGEVLFYKNALSDADRKDTEAYLMNKWLGITPAGYGDPSAMTIAGSGTVKLANHVTAKPQFAAAFAGTVGAAVGALTFTVAQGTATTVADPLALGGGTFDAGEALAVNIKLDGRVAPGRYLLVDAAAWTGAEPTLGTVEKTVASKRTCALVREGGKLYVNVELPGLAILVR